MKMKKSLKWIAGAVVVLAAVSVYELKNNGVQAEVTTLKKGEMVQYLEDTAQVLSNDKQTVYFESVGKVTDVYADVGDSVKKGELLLSLDKSDLELQLKDAKAKIEAAKATLSGTELKSYANQIEQAQVSVDQAQNSMESAEKNVQNAKALYEAGALSKNDFDTAEDTYQAAESSLNLAKLQLKNVQQGAPEYLKESYSAQLKQAVIYRDTILHSMEKQNVRAPIDGVVIERLIDKYAPAAAAAPAFIIENVKSLKLESDILADDAGKVKIGDEVQISGKAIGEAMLKGKITKIAPAAKTITSSLGVDQKRVPVTISLADTTGLIKPGYDLDIKIVLSRKTDIIKVTDTSVFDYKGSSHVFVLENGKAILRQVKKGIESGDEIEITEGLKEGECILVKPDNNIKEGIKIKTSK
ncbi:MAG: efflux RND transporter periplasmic adaptor subunit [Clostridiales bacterium]|nr:efflux RND transporter periplasmic adaptor subunit [Clostridiales bacterium]